MKLSTIKQHHLSLAEWKCLYMICADRNDIEQFVNIIAFSKSLKNSLKSYLISWYKLNLWVNSEGNKLNNMFIFLWKKSLLESAKRNSKLS